MNNRPFDGVIFDFNGTLFFDNDKHVKAWSEISRIIRASDLSEQELHENCNGLPNHMIIRYLSNGTSTPEMEQKYSIRKEQIYRQLCRQDGPNFHLVKGASQIFDALSQAGIPFTIASASIKDNIDFFVESFDLDRWIQPEDIQYDDGRFPDKVEMLKAACRVLGTSPERTLVIEDSISGVNSARNAGIEDIRIINSAHTPDLFRSMGIEIIGEDFTQLHILEDLDSNKNNQAE